MASISNTNEKTERCLSQMAKEHLGHFLEGQNNKEARVRTGQRSMDEILSKRRFCWLGNVI